MLDVLGLPTVDELFAPIPDPLLHAGLDLPPGLSESETRAYVEALAALDRPSGPFSFLGAGHYQHDVPAAVRGLVARGEFSTAYTPYQAEVSQGTLQHIFEFQTTICELTGMESANASLYDGPSAVAEAVFMAARLTGRHGCLLSAGIHPQTRRVVHTYASGPGITIADGPLDPGSATTILPSPEQGIAAVVVQQPNFYGVIEDLEPLAHSAHAVGAILVVAVDPLVLGVIEAPGAMGADIVVGDAQAFGNPMSFGGPSVGFLACRTEHVRQIPGRIVGQTVDSLGSRSYTLTLQTREQHIRRARATSNICSNQALSALAATIHLALLGPSGLRRLGEVCLQRAHHLQRELCALPGVRLLVDGPFFYEFALSLPLSAADFARRMRQRDVDPGVPLSRVPDFVGALLPAAGNIDPQSVLLVAATESNTPEALERYVIEARGVLEEARTALAETA